MRLRLAIKGWVVAPWATHREESGFCFYDIRMLQLEYYNVLMQVNICKKNNNNYIFYEINFFHFFLQVRRDDFFIIIILGLKLHLYTFFHDLGFHLFFIFL